MNDLAEDIWSLDAQAGGRKSGALVGNALAINTDLRREFENSWQAAFDRIDNIFLLEADWDGDDAEVPDEELLTSITEWFDDLYKQKVAPPSRVVAEIDGAILVEWHSADSGYLEAEISAPYVAELMFHEPGQVPQHDVIGWHFVKKSVSPLWNMG